MRPAWRKRDRGGAGDAGTVVPPLRPPAPYELRDRPPSCRQKLWIFGMTSAMRSAATSRRVSSCSCVAPTSELLALALCAADPTAIAEVRAWHRRDGRDQEKAENDRKTSNYASVHEVFHPLTCSSCQTALFRSGCMDASRRLTCMPIVPLPPTLCAVTGFTRITPLAIPIFVVGDSRSRNGRVT